ncbi:hypothetical protein [Streptomyces sp. HNM1019]|uniref:hypothetical protein n=1 Tax=Streptomyces sp. HNM1019 TaxID=3424717 RepID=UPI003D77BE0F
MTLISSSTTGAVGHDTTSMTPDSEVPLAVANCRATTSSRPIESTPQPYAPTPKAGSTIGHRTVRTGEDSDNSCSTAHARRRSHPERHAPRPPRRTAVTYKGAVEALADRQGLHSNGRV